MTGKAYTMKEMKAIVNYLVEHKAYKEIRGRKMWMDYANSKETTRTWQSLKETFLKRILPDIHNPYYKLTVSQIASFKQGDDIEAKLNNKLEIQREPIEENDDVAGPSKENGDTSSQAKTNGNDENLNKDGHQDVSLDIPDLGEEIQSGEDPKTSDNVNNVRDSTETIVLQNCYETAEDIQKDLEETDTDGTPPNQENQTENDVMPANLVEVVTSDVDNNEVQQKTNNSDKQRTVSNSPIEISDSESKTETNKENKNTTKETTKTPESKDNSNQNDSQKNKSTSILSGKDDESNKQEKHEESDKSKKISQNISNSTIDTQLPNNPEELKNNKKDMTKKSLQLNCNKKRATSLDIEKRREPKLSKPVSDTDAVKNHKTKEVIIEEATNSQKQNLSNDAQVVNVDLLLDKNEANAKTNKTNASISPQIENPCLKSVNLFEAQFSSTLHSDSDDLVETVNEPEPKKKADKPQTSKDKTVVIDSNSESSSDTVIVQRKLAHKRIQKKRHSALDYALGYRKMSTKRQRRHSYSARRSGSHHRNTTVVSDSSESSYSSDSEFVSPPDKKKHRRGVKYLKPNSGRILSLQDNGGLFVVDGDKIYPLVCDNGKVLSYAAFDTENCNDASYWKLKYAEEKKKTEELDKLLRERKAKSPDIAPEATTTTLEVPKESSSKPSEPAAGVKDKALKIKITKNNVELEGHWSQINPVIDKFVHMIRDEKEPEKVAHADNNETHEVSGTSTPAEITKNRVNELESQILKTTEQLEEEEAKDKEELEPVRKSVGRRKASTTTVTTPKKPRMSDKQTDKQTVRRKSTRTPTSLTSETTVNKSKKGITKKVTPKKVQNQKVKEVDEDEILYKFPSPPRETRGRKPPRARYTIRYASKNYSPEKVWPQSEESQYIDSDGSPFVCSRKKNSAALAARKHSVGFRKKSVPSLTEDLSSDNTLSFATVPQKSKSASNTSLNSQIYRTDSYQLLMPKTKIAPKPLETIDESNNKSGNQSVDDNIQDEIQWNRADVSGEVSLPTSPALSIVENITINKTLLSNNNSENDRDNRQEKITLNTLMSKEGEVDPLMESNFTVMKKSDDGVKYHYSLQEPCVSDTILEQLGLVALQDTTISSKLNNLRIESAKKTAKINPREENIDEKVVKTKPRKRSSTPRLRSKAKPCFLEPCIEESTAACLRSNMKSCPPVIQISDFSVETEQKTPTKENKRRERKKKDVLKVKITKPDKRKKSSDRSRTTTPDKTKNDNIESGIFLQDLNDSVDVIHNHSETCLQAADCVNDDSVQLIEGSPMSVVSLITSPIAKENNIAQYEEHGALDQMANVSRSSSAKTSATMNSLITEDMSLDVTPRSSWFLFSDEDSTQFKEPPPPAGFQTNLNALFTTCAVPNLSTITEASKDVDENSNFDKRK